MGPIPVTTTPVGGDEAFRRAGVSGTAHLVPPLTDTRDGELGRIMINPHTNPICVTDRTINALWDDLAELGIGKVMRIHFDRLTLRVIFLASIFKNYRLVPYLLASTDITG